MKGLSNDSKADATEPGASSGRRVFGASRKESQEHIDEDETDAIGDGSDSEAERRSLSRHAVRNSSQRLQRPSEDTKTSHEGAFKVSRFRISLDRVFRGNIYFFMHRLI